MKKKKWWYYALWIFAFLLFLPFVCVYGVYRSIINFKKSKNLLWLFAIVPLLFFGSAGVAGYVGAFTGDGNARIEQTTSSSSSKDKDVEKKAKASKEAETAKKAEATKKSKAAKKAEATKKVEATKKAEAAKKVQEASDETEVSETGISENETSGGQNGNNYQ